MTSLSQLVEKKIRVKIPNKINVLGKDFTVTRKKMVKDHHGECDGSRYQITLSNAETLEASRQTLFHEAIHAALYVSGLSNVINDDNLEEAIVISLENAFSHAVDVDKLTLDKFSRK